MLGQVLTFAEHAHVMRGSGVAVTVTTSDIRMFRGPFHADNASGVRRVATRRAG
jgi:hypothetical protein